MCPQKCTSYIPSTRQANKPFCKFQAPVGVCVKAESPGSSIIGGEAIFYQLLSLEAQKITGREAVIHSHYISLKFLFFCLLMVCHCAALKHVTRWLKILTVKL